MNILKCLLSVCLSMFVFLTMSFSQEQYEDNYEFLRKRAATEGYTIFFDVINLKNNHQAEMILQDLLSHEDVYDGRFFTTRDNKNRFHLFMYNVISANEIREIIIQHNVDYTLEHVSKNGEISERNRGVHVSELGSERKPIDYSDYPKYIDTGDKEQDRIIYNKRKEQWINENPEKYQRILNELKNK